ncbi:hypothetical protein [Kordiimonas sp.]|uniref:hypothetical protein n=1 Tax=Kordiimonas sp. TaxID=1970157 RepID=UPI003B51CAC9
MKSVFCRVKQLVPCLKSEELEALLKEATKLNCYAYADLQDWQIPYILVMLRVFIPSESLKKSRKTKIRFFYDQSARDGEALWIDGDLQAKLFRAFYWKNKVARIDEISVTADYLADKNASIAPWQLERFLRYV